MYIIHKTIYSFVVLNQCHNVTLWMEDAAQNYWDDITFLNRNNYEGTYT